MAYYLHLFRLDEGTAPPAGTEATAIPNWIRANGRPVGEMEFGAGRATFVLVVLTKMSGVDLAPLQEGPWKDWACEDLDVGFGGLSGEEARQAVEGLRAVAVSPEKQAELGRLGVQWGLQDEDLKGRCAKMATLLQRCVADGGEAVSLYQ